MQDQEVSQLENSELEEAIKRYLSRFEHIDDNSKSKIDQLNEAYPERPAYRWMLKNAVEVLEETKSVDQMVCTLDLMLMPEVVDTIHASSSLDTFEDIVFSISDVIKYARNEDTVKNVAELFSHSISTDSSNLPEIAFALLNITHNYSNHWLVNKTVEIVREYETQPKLQKEILSCLGRLGFKEKLHEDDLSVFGSKLIDSFSGLGKEGFSGLLNAVSCLLYNSSADEINETLLHMTDLSHFFENYSSLDGARELSSALTFITHNDLIIAKRIESILSDENTINVINSYKGQGSREAMLAFVSGLKYSPEKESVEKINTLLTRYQKSNGLEKAAKAIFKSIKQTSGSDSKVDLGSVAFDNIVRKTADFSYSFEQDKEKSNHCLEEGRQLTGTRFTDISREALILFEDALLYNPANIQAYIEKGKTYLSIARLEDDMGMIVKAVDSLSEAIKLDPDNIQANHERSKAYALLSDFENAVKDLEAVIESDPTSEHYKERGVLWFVLGEYTNALSDLTRAIALDPEDYDAYKQRADLFLKNEQLDEALEDYNKVLELAEEKVSDEDMKFKILKLVHDNRRPIKEKLEDDNILLQDDSSLESKIISTFVKTSDTYKDGSFSSEIAETLFSMAKIYLRQLLKDKKITYHTIDDVLNIFNCFSNHAEIKNQIKDWSYVHRLISISSDLLESSHESCERRYLEACLCRESDKVLEKIFDNCEKITNTKEMTDILDSFDWSSRDAELNDPEINHPKWGYLASYFYYKQGKIGYVDEIVKGCAKIIIHGDKRLDLYVDYLLKFVNYRDFYRFMNIISDQISHSKSILKKDYIHSFKKLVLNKKVNSWDREILKGDIDNIIEFLDQIKDKEFIAYSCLGLAHLKKGEYEKAKENFSHYYSNVILDESVVKILIENLRIDFSNFDSYKAVDLYLGQLYIIYNRDINEDYAKELLLEIQNIRFDTAKKCFQKKDYQKSLHYLGSMQSDLLGEDTSSEVSLLRTYASYNISLFELALVNFKDYVKLEAGKREKCDFDGLVDKVSEIIKSDDPKGLEERWRFYGLILEEIKRNADLHEKAALYKRKVYTEIMFIADKFSSSGKDDNALVILNSLDESDLDEEFLLNYYWMSAKCMVSNPENHDTVLKHLKQYFSLRLQNDDSLDNLVEQINDSRIIGKSKDSVSFALNLFGVLSEAVDDAFIESGNSDNLISAGKKEKKIKYSFAVDSMKIIYIYNVAEIHYSRQEYKKVCSLLQNHNLNRIDDNIFLPMNLMLAYSKLALCQKIESKWIEHLIKESESAPVFRNAFESILISSDYYRAKKLFDIKESLDDIVEGLPSIFKNADALHKSRARDIYSHVRKERNKRIGLCAGAAVLALYSYFLSPLLYNSTQAPNQDEKPKTEISSVEQTVIYYDNSFDTASIDSNLESEETAKAPSKTYAKKTKTGSKENIDPTKLNKDTKKDTKELIEEALQKARKIFTGSYIKDKHVDPSTMLCLKLAVDSDPSNMEYNWLLMNSYYINNEYEKAISLFERIPDFAFKKDKYTAATCSIAGMSYYKNKDFCCASYALSKSWSNQPSSYYDEKLGIASDPTVRLNLLLNIGKEYDKLPLQKKKCVCSNK